MKLASIARPLTPLIAAAGMLTIPACGGSGADPASGESAATRAQALAATSSGPSSASCGALAGRTFTAASLGAKSRGAVVTATEYVRARAEAMNADGTAMVKALPDYCKVLIDIAPVDAAAPTTKVQVNLPTQWNGKKLQIGGGGFNGSLQSATRDLRNAPVDRPLPLMRGYMTTGTDSGHQFNPQDRNVEAQAFALNAEALLNFAHASYKNANDVAVQTAQLYYGRKPGKSYYFGASEGGREAMMMAQRYPDDFDGVVAIDPVLNWSGLQTFGNWVGGIKQNTAGSWIGEKIQLIHDTVEAACDSLDGITDHVVSNYGACKPLADAALGARRCASGNDEGASCFSDGQLETIAAARRGYSFAFPLANGVTSYPGYLYGGEALKGNWQGSIGGNKAPTFSGAPNDPQIGMLFAFGNGYVRYFIAGDKDFDPFGYDPSNFRSRVEEVSAMMDATNPDLSAFRSKGGKLILKEDLSDSAQSAAAGIQYYNSVVNRMGGVAAVDAVMRFYVAPGLPHTSDGVAAGSLNAPSYGIPASVDWLAILENWAEGGSPPAPRIVTVMQNPTPPYATTASKPVCRYPAYPRYIGASPSSGHLASNYSCAGS